MWEGWGGCGPREGRQGSVGKREEQGGAERRPRLGSDAARRAAERVVQASRHPQSSPSPAPPRSTPIKDGAAAKLGLVDAVVPPERLLEAAKALALDIAGARCAALKALPRARFCSCRGMTCPGTPCSSHHTLSRTPLQPASAHACRSCAAPAPNPRQLTQSATPVPFLCLFAQPAGARAWRRCTAPIGWSLWARRWRCCSLRARRCAAACVAGASLAWACSGHGAPAWAPLGSCPTFFPLPPTCAARAGGQAGAQPAAPAAVPGRHPVRRGARRPRRPAEGELGPFRVAECAAVHRVDTRACERDQPAARHPPSSCRPRPAAPARRPSPALAGGRLLCCGGGAGHAQGAGAHLLRAALHQEDQG